MAPVIRFFFFDFETKLDASIARSLYWMSEDDTVWYIFSKHKISHIFSFKLLTTKRPAIGYTHFKRLLQDPNADLGDLRDLTCIYN
jgi:hypothetical protein